MAISDWTISDWEDVIRRDYPVPPEPPLPELTTELTAMLGDPDPHVRRDVAYRTLSAWIARGEYDDLLTGLGDGMVTGLHVGLGETEGDSVFRRSSCALVLAACIDRDTLARTVPDTQILIWGDRLVTWLLDERDLRSVVPDRGWAHCLAHGADAIGALGASPHLGPDEQQVMLQVLGERLEATTGIALTAGEPDRYAGAVLRILRRNDLTASDLEAWVEALGAAAEAGTGIGADNVQAFLRALYVRLSLESSTTVARADLLLLLLDALRVSNPHFLAQPSATGSSLPS